MSFARCSISRYINKKRFAYQPIDNSMAEDHKESIEKPRIHYKDDWYQTEEEVVIVLFLKNVDTLESDNVRVVISPDTVKITISMPNLEVCELCFNLLHEIVINRLRIRTRPSKIEVYVTKKEGLRWEKLEGPPTKALKAIKIGPSSQLDKPPSYPTSKIGKDWSAVEKEIEAEEAKEKPEGEEAVNKLFQEIYGKGSDEVKRAMNKSYMESGGTVLSTNWNEIAKDKVEVKPPDGMEFKKWN